MILIANNKGLSQKSLVLALLIATSGVALFIGIDTISNNNQAQAQQQAQTKINKVWETPNKLKNPESVLYAPKQDALFVSNIDGKPAKKIRKDSFLRSPLLTGA